MLRVDGKVIIGEIVRAMREQEEPLRFSVCVSSCFRVCLHPDDHARLSSLLPKIASEARQALDRELEELNRRRLADRFLGERPRYERLGNDWEIEFDADPNGEVPRGEVRVRSEFASVEMPELAGMPTIEECAAPPVERSPEERPLATISYAGPKGRETFVVTKDEVWIGRPGGAARVDIELHHRSVSRPHLRIRRDRLTGTFFIANFGSYGTTLNGQSIPGQKLDRSGKAAVEMQLPDRARIGLAEDVVVLDFERVPSL